MKKLYVLVLFLIGSAALLFALDALKVLPNGLVVVGEAPTNPRNMAETKFKVHGRMEDVTGLVMPVGSIMPYGGKTAPAGWLLCNGDAVNRADYNALFDVIGTSFGIGDMNTTFNVPDLRGMFLRGSGTNGIETLKKVNGAAYAGPAVGGPQYDQMQGHKHNDTGHSHIEGFAGVNQFGSWGVAHGVPGGNINQQNGGSGNNHPYVSPSYANITPPVTDGANGTPRTGDETSPVSVGVNYIIKY